MKNRMPEFSDFPWISQKDFKHLKNRLTRMPWPRKKSWTDRVSEKVQDYYDMVAYRVSDLPGQSGKSLKDRMPSMPRKSKGMMDRVSDIDMPWESHWTDRVTSRVPRMPWQSKGMLDRVSDIEMPDMEMPHMPKAARGFGWVLTRVPLIMMVSKLFKDRAEGSESYHKHEMGEMKHKHERGETKHKHELGEMKKETGGLPTWLWFFLALPVGFYGLYMWRRRQEQKRWQNWQTSDSAFRERQMGESYNPQSREAFMGESTPTDAASSLPTSTPIGGGGSGDEAYTRNVRAEDTNLTDRFRSQDMGLTFTDTQPAGTSPVSDERIAADLEGDLTDEEDVAMEERGQVAVTGGFASDTMEAEATTAQTGKQDDLTLIEGIGPSISNLLRSQGITSYRQLANTSIDRLDSILREADLRRISDPGTWPEQARLAADGDMDALTRFQNTLKAGRRPSR